MNIHSVQREVWGERKSGAPAVLNDYDLRSGDKLYVKKKYGEQVVGKVYQLEDEELKKTDKEGYKMIKTKLDGFEGLVGVYVLA